MNNHISPLDWTLAGISERCAALEARLLDRGFQNPEVRLWVPSPTGSMVLQAQAGKETHMYFYPRIAEPETLETTFARAKGWVDSLESLAEIAQREFIRDLAGLIERGYCLGLEPDFLNPLEGSMKKLSSNALSHD